MQDKKAYQVKEEQKAAYERMQRQYAIEQDIEETEAKWNKKTVFQTLISQASLGDVEGIVRSLEDGVSSNCQGEQCGDTPLVVACEHGHLKAAQLLLDRKATINMKSKRGLTPLMAAAAHGRMDCLELLLRSGASVDETEESGYSAMHLAVRSGRMECVDPLLEAGADINIKTHDGETPIIIASEQNNKEGVQRLIDLKADMNLQDKHGETALASAARDNFPEIVKTLIIAKVNPAIRTHSGKTPLQLAKDAKHDLIVKFILNASETSTLLLAAIASSKHKQLKEIIYYAEELNCGDPTLLKKARYLLNLSSRLSASVKKGKYNPLLIIVNEAKESKFGDLELLDRANEVLEVSTMLTDSLEDCELKEMEDALSRADNIKFGDHDLMQIVRETIQAIHKLEKSIHTGIPEDLKDALAEAERVHLRSVRLIETANFHLETNRELNKAIWKWERFTTHLKSAIKRAVRSDFGNAPLLQDARAVLQLEKDIETGSEGKISEALGVVYKLRLHLVPAVKIATELIEVIREIRVRTKEGIFRPLLKIIAKAKEIKLNDTALIASAEEVCKIGQDIFDGIENGDIELITRSLQLAEELNFGDKRLIGKAKGTLQIGRVLDKASQTGDLTTLKTGMTFARWIAFKNLGILAKAKTGLMLHRAVETEKKSNLFVSLDAARKCRFPFQPLVTEAQRLYDMHLRLEACLRHGEYEETILAIKQAESIKFLDEKKIQKCRRSRDMTPELLAAQETVDYNKMHFAMTNAKHIKFGNKKLMASVKLTMKGARLLKAFEQNDLKMVQTMLRKKADINIVNEKKWTALHFTCWHGHYAGTRFLLDRGVDVHQVNDVGRTPLHLAVKNGHCKVVVDLLEKKADINALDKFEMTPLKWANWERTVAKVLPIVHLLATNDIVELMREKYGPPKKVVIKPDLPPLDLPVTADVEATKKGKGTGKLVRVTLVHRYDTDGYFRVKLGSGKIIKRVSPEWVRICAEVQPVKKGKPTGCWLPCWILSTTTDGQRHTIELMRSGKVFKMADKWLRMLKPVEKKKDEKGKKKGAKGSVLKRAGSSITS